MVISLLSPSSFQGATKGEGALEATAPHRSKNFAGDASGRHAAAKAGIGAEMRGSMPVGRPSRTSSDASKF